MSKEIKTLYKIKQCESCNKRCHPTSGRQKYCVKCQPIKRKEKIKRSSKIYFRKYYESNKLQENERKARWYQENKERVLASCKKYRKENPEAVKRSIQKWKEKNLNYWRKKIIIN